MYDFSFRSAARDDVGNLLPLLSAGILCDLFIWVSGN